MGKDFYIEPRDGIYYFRFRDPITGKIGNGKSSRLRNRDAAIAWATLEYEKIKAKAGSSSSPFKDWASKFFIKDCPHIERVLNEGKTYSDSTRDNNRDYLLEILKDPIALIPLNQISRPDVISLQERIVKKHGRSRTAQQVYSVFRIVINEAMYRGRITYNPCFGVKQISYKKKPRKALTRAEAEAFLVREYWRDEQHWLMATTARYTGMRAGEIRGVFWEDILVDKGLIHVKHNLPQNVGAEGLKSPKWNKERVYPYPKELKKLLEPRRKEGLVFEVNGDPVDYWAWHDSVKAARKKAGAGGIHALRHTINTELAEKGVPKELRKALFGWSSDQVADGYTHPENYDISKLAGIIDATVGKGTKKGQQSRT